MSLDDRAGPATPPAAAGDPDQPAPPVATTGLSVICVYDDPLVRAECLDASLQAAGPEARDAAGDLLDPYELIAVDNVGHAFASAGAALNHGARRARHDVVVLVHQDVYLHSLPRLHEIAAVLRTGAWGMVGACGITADGTIVGALRDRVQLIGVSAPEPLAVDSVDEVLVCLRRDLLLAHPLSEDPDLAWHAYAVEQTLRLRRLGLPTGAADCAITHNSRTTNLARLDVAHDHVAAAYPELLPVRTTCGVLGRAAPGLRHLGVVQAHTWRRRWLVESGRALRAGRHVATRPTVLADIRLDVDDLVWAEDRSLHVVNIDTVGGFARWEAAPLRLTRGLHTLWYRSVRSAEAAVALLDAGAPRESWLVTNLAPGDVRRVAGSRAATGASTLLGVHDHDLWLLVGPVAEQSPAAWSLPRAVPLLAAPA